MDRRARTDRDRERFGVAPYADLAVTADGWAAPWTGRHPEVRTSGG
ncbi:hypothetical protein [Streptomyces lavendofoliae]|nr:hypothetical protein [Streptomyces lavendofoliae]